MAVAGCRSPGAQPAGGSAADAASAAMSLHACHKGKHTGKSFGVESRTEPVGGAPKLLAAKRDLLTCSTATLMLRHAHNNLC